MQLHKTHPPSNIRFSNINSAMNVFRPGSGLSMSMNLCVYDYHGLHEETKQDGQGPRASDGRT